MDKKNIILIVDDMEINRCILRQLFEPRYDIIEAKNGIEALEIIGRNSQSIVMILLDIIMPEMDGFGVLEVMQRENLLTRIPVVLITGDSSTVSAKRGYDFGTADIIVKPFDLSIVERRVENIIDLYQHKNNLERLVDEQTQKIAVQAKKLKEFDNFLIDTLSTVVEFRSLESGQHISRIRGFTKVLLNYVAASDKKHKLSAELVNVISSASALHDIGKIAIPDSILLKPAKLEPWEFEVMKTHTLKGCEILESMEYIHDKQYFQYSYNICRSHHERWDGKGYPDGLIGDEIPMCAQIVSIADVYDALASERVYKPAFTPMQAKEMIINGECGAFNPKLIECFISASDEMAGMVRRSAQTMPHSK